MPAPDGQFFQLVVCWFFLMTGRCEPIAVSPPIPEHECARLAEKVRRRPSKFIAAVCIS